MVIRTSNDLNSGITNSKALTLNSNIKRDKNESEEIVCFKFLLKTVGLATVPLTLKEKL